MRRPLPVVLLILSLMAPVSAGAGEPSTRPVVLVLLRSASGSEFEILRLLIVDSIRIELSSRELDAVIPAEVWQARDSPASLAKRAGADFALAGTYDLAADEQVSIELRLIEAGGTSAIPLITRKGPLDFSFDALVAGAISEALEGQKNRIASARSARVEAARVATEKAAADRSAAEKAAIEKAAGEKAAADKSAAEKAAAERAAFEKAANAKAKEEADRKIAAVLQRPVRHWSLFAAGAPFLATVEASEYFTLGLSVAVNGQYRFSVPGGLLGIGLATGLQRFHATGTAGEADSTLIPIGGTFTYGTNTGSRYDFFAHIDGGAALFILQPISGNASMGVVPYSLGGVGMTIAVFEKAGFIIDASYTAFFPRGVPIMGFSPSLGLFLRF
jgi:hypothetical protein